MKHLLVKSKSLISMIFIITIVNTTYISDSKDITESTVPQLFEINVDDINSQHEIFIECKKYDTITLKLSGEMLKNSPQYVNKSIAENDFNISKSFSVESKFKINNGIQTNVSVGMGTYKISPIKTGERVLAIKLFRTNSLSFNPRTTESNTEIILRFNVEKSEISKNSSKEVPSDAVSKQSSETNINFEDIFNSFNFDDDFFKLNIN